MVIGIRNFCQIQILITNCSQSVDVSSHVKQNVLSLVFDMILVYDTTTTYSFFLASQTMITPGKPRSIIDTIQEMKWVLVNDKDVALRSMTLRHLLLRVPILRWQVECTNSISWVVWLLLLGVITSHLRRPNILTYDTVCILIQSRTAKDDFNTAFEGFLFHGTAGPRTNRSIIQTFRSTGTCCLLVEFVKKIVREFITIVWQNKSAQAVSPHCELVHSSLISGTRVQPSLLL